MSVRGVKMADNKNEENKSKPENELKEKKVKAKKSNLLRAMMDEYKKIVWLSFGDLCKQTVNVIFVCLFFGVIIFGIDAGFGYFMNYVTNILSK